MEQKSFHPIRDETDIRPFKAIMLTSVDSGLVSLATPSVKMLGNHVTNPFISIEVEIKDPYQLSRNDVPRAVLFNESNYLIVRPHSQIHSW